MSAVRSGVTALVTGAASGIGAATARLIAPNCRHLVLHGRATRPESQARLEATAAECAALGPQVLTLTGDLAEPGTGKSLVERTVDRCGGLDHLVSNAGFADKRSVAELGRADVDRSYAAMTGAFFELAQTAMPAL
jgi:NAD(P)-dependent dehydrogenase (short-subunit alcohol dehydrogenase family)